MAQAMVGVPEYNEEILAPDSQMEVDEEIPATQEEVPPTAAPVKHRRKMSAINITRRTMRILQQSTEEMVEKTIMNDIIKSIVPDDFKVTDNAKKALRVIADDFMNMIMEDVNMFTDHANRKLSMAADMQMARRMAQRMYPNIDFGVKPYKTVQLEREMRAAKARREANERRLLNSVSNKQAARAARAEKVPQAFVSLHPHETYDQLCARLNVDPEAHTQEENIFVEETQNNNNN